MEVHAVHFPWAILRSIIAGASAVDLEGLAFGDRRHADGFLAAYGYDPKDPETRKELEVIRAKSLTFLKDELLFEEPTLSIPPEIGECEVGDLLVHVSKDPQSEEGMWSCALLRVMHAFAHSRNDPFEKHRDSIRQQILHRIERHLYEGDEGELRLGRGQDSVPLEAFAPKEAKSPHRVVMKLLHKPGNLGESIHDHLGVRFIAKDLMGVLQIIRYLRTHNVVVFANVAPDRSRNTLFNLDAFQRFMDEVSLPGRDTAALLAGTSFRETINRFRYQEAGGTNVRSSKSYRAIHFTVRQLVTLNFSDGERLRLFFPYEVQVMDREAFEEIKHGDAAHENYVKRQRRAVKRRVLRGLLPRRARSRPS